MHLCKSTIPQKKKSLLIPCRVGCRGSVNQKAIWRIIGRKFYREGIGRFWSKLPFFFPSFFPHTDMQTAPLSKYKGFSFFLCFWKKPNKQTQITNGYCRTPQPCIVYLSNPLPQCYRKAMEVLQCSLTRYKKNCPICKENTIFWPQH